MTPDPTHPEPGPFGPLPAGLTEADLLDWVEQRLPAGRAGAIEIAIRANRPLAARLEEMRIDRAALASLPELAAPIALLDAVERALERQMLVGLATGEPLTELPPVSAVRPHRHGPFSFGATRGDAVGRRLALAAAVVLLVGGASILGVIAMQLAGKSTPPMPPSNDSPLAIAAPDHPAVPTDTPRTPDQGGELAINDGPAQGPAPAAAANPDEIPAAPAMTLARATELAREGRLIVRVRSRELDRTLLRLGRIADRPRQAWRLGEDAPGTVIAILQTDAPRMVDPSIEPLVLGWSDPEGMGPPEIPLAPFVVARVEVERVIPTVFLAQVRTDEAALAGLLAALDATTIHSAVFEEAAAPMPTAPPTLQFDAVLWWDQDPAFWRTWVGVPVVVASDH